MINSFSGECQLFFDPTPREVFFPLGVEIALLPIILYPEVAGYIELQFNVILVVPLAAVSQGVVLGEPNKTIVTVPASRGVYPCLNYLVNTCMW